MPAAITDYFGKYSNGSQPIPTTLSAQKLAGATTASLTTATGWDTTTVKHVRMYNTTVSGTQTIPDQSSICIYKATLSGTTLSNLTLVWSATGSDQTYAAGATVDLAVTPSYTDQLATGILTSLDQDGTLKAGAVDVTAVVADAIITRAKLASALSTEVTTGWLSGDLPAVSSVTYNGNRSYDITFASTVASLLSSGMRLKGTKTVAGNGYMGGAFNGSSHYFTKATPSGTLGTVTNNFTIEAVVQPTSYPATFVFIAGRSDATPNNGFGLRMETSGQISVYIWNAAAANFRGVLTYQSVPLNKKTHVAASWTGGTVVIYFDGVSVPVQAASTGGTAPTTAGTGGDFSIGRLGAYAASYFPGYISNVAIFDAVLTAATIKQHATYKLLGSETNCIGAWSLDNTANDQSSAANNLTATGGVGYTAMSPHGQMGDAVHTDQFAALVMSVSTTTATVQVPEGCTIPTSGGVTSVAYSVQGNPFGWVSDKGRWEVVTLYKTTIVQASATTAVVYNPAGVAITVPVGAFQVGFEVQATGTGSTGVDKNLEVQLSTSSSSITLDDLYTEFFNTVFVIRGTFARNNYRANFTAATPLYLLFRLNGAGTLSSVGIVNTNQSKVYALPTGL